MPRRWGGTQTSCSSFKRRTFSPFWSTTPWDLTARWPPPGRSSALAAGKSHCAHSAGGPHRNRIGSRPPPNRSTRQNRTAIGGQKTHETQEWTILRLERAGPFEFLSDEHRAATRTDSGQRNKTQSGKQSIQSGWMRNSIEKRKVH